MPGQLRHLAMSVPDPWKTAEFYRYAFGFKVIGETDSRLAEGVYITDGVLNIALLKYKADEAAQGKGKDFVGLHHIGFVVDDTDAADHSIRENGGSFHRPAGTEMQAEIKYRDPNGIVFDISRPEHAWKGVKL
jgi:catechol 2,3-dioxygenase-like lactoylglutathione lyase family enzyme